MRVPSGEIGYTLIELMIGITVAAILIAIAVPSFTATINRNRLATAANELLTSLQLARMEAVRRGAPVVVCASADANAAVPACDGAGWGQWFAFVDTDADGVFDNGEVVLRVSAVNPNVQMAAQGGLDKLIFRSDGLSYATSGALLSVVVNACIETTQPEANGRNIRVRTGSAILVQDAAPDPNCTAPG